MSWSNLGGNSQRTSADPSGNITTVTELWARYGGSENKNGWAGGVITDSDSVYYFYQSYYPDIGGTGARFSLNRYDKAGNLIWANKQLGYHDALGTWPARARPITYDGVSQVPVDAVIYHDYKFGPVNKYTGAQVPGGWIGGDSYGNVAFNPSQTKMFACRTYWNEGIIGKGWVKAFDLTVFFNSQQGTLWVRNLEGSAETFIDDHQYIGVGGNILYDNSKVFYCPHYSGISLNFHSGIYCWDEAGVEQWNVVSSPHSRASAGNGMLYMMESPNGYHSTDKSLVARSQTNGSIVWSTVITGYSMTGQPPVLVNNLVIMASSTGVHARNATTGAVEWDAAITNIDFPTDPNQRKDLTVLAAAVTSNTLVACSKNGLYILSLTDGSVVQLYNPPSITGRPTNPIIDGNRVYITDATDTYQYTGMPETIICLESSGTPPPTDVTPPSAPGTPTFSAVTTSHITVSWAASTDNILVSYYNLFYRLSGGTWASMVKTTTSHTFTGLTSGTYEFYVNAVDSSGNVSADSATASQATVPVATDTTPPSTPGDPTFSNVTSTSITTSWAASTDDYAVNYYTIYWRVAGGTFTPINKTTTSHNFTGLTSGITYEFYVTATDTSGNISSSSNTTAQATETVVVDTTPPTTPGNPTFSSVTTTGMVVSWAASSDTSGISYYRLFWRQSGGQWTVINESTTSHAFTNLTGNTTYEFYVNAVDNAGNISSDSAITSQTTLTPALNTQISGTVTITAATGFRTTHNLNWQNVPATMALQRRTGKTSYVTIYTGDAPYSYEQTDLNTNYYYRILTNGTTASNEIVLMSKRK